MSRMPPEDIIRSIIELEAQLQEEVATEERKAAAWLAERKQALEAGIDLELRNISEGLSRAGQQRLEAARTEATRIEAAAVREEGRLDALTDEALMPLVAGLLRQSLFPS